MKIGKTEEACNIFRMLVNENYNATMNAQILSRLYVDKIISGDDSYRVKYEILTTRFMDTKYLFPLPQKLPETEWEKKALSETFIDLQKKNMIHDFADVMYRYTSMCENRYYQLCGYRGSIASEMATLIKDISNAAEILVGKHGKTLFLQAVKDEIDKEKKFWNMVEQGNDRNQGINNVSFRQIFRYGFIYYVIDDFIDRIKHVTDMSGLSELETVICEFINVNLNTEENIEEIGGFRNDIEEIFDREFIKKLEVSREVKECKDALEKHYLNQSSLVKPSGKTEFIIRGDIKFIPYLERNKKLFRRGLNEDSVVAIINDTRMTDVDLIFTTRKLYVSVWTAIKSDAEYKNISFAKAGDKLCIGDYKFYNSDIVIEKLNEVLRIFAELVNTRSTQDERSLAKEIQNHILKY